MRIGRRGLWTVVGAFALALATPANGRCEHASFTLYGGLFGNKAYVEGWEGVQATVGVHDYVSLIGRITGVHILDSDRFREGNSGVGQGGLGFTVAPNTSIAVLGGSYFGEIYDPVIEGDFSTAQLFGGAESYIYNEGQFRRNGDFVRNPERDDVKVAVGGALSVYKRSWDAGLKLGCGGGDYGVYGTMTVFKTFTL